MHSRIVLGLIALATSAAMACASRVDIDNVPVGSEVQLTRDDGGVVEGTLAERDANLVRVQSALGMSAVPRDEIAVVQVVTPGKPATLPGIAKFREYVVPGGTSLALNLDTAVSSDSSRVEDPVNATLATPVRMNGVDVLPAGSEVRGTVTDARPAGRVRGRAILAVHFDTVVAHDARYPISAGLAVQASSTKGKDAATIALPAVGGAVIGGLLGGNKGAAAGAAIGGGAGTGIVLSTKGRSVRFNRGANVRVRLAESVPVRVPVRRTEGG